MKKSFVLALLTVVAFSVAQAQQSADPVASATPAPTKAEKKAAKKKKKKHVTKEAEAQKSNVTVPEGVSPGVGADTKPVGSSGAASNAENILESTSPDQTKKTVTNPPKNGDIDDEITNAKLRAQTGSKSRFSFQSAINYNGGSLAKPFDAERPKLSPGTVIQEPSLVGGTVAAKYRISEHDNLNLGAGVNWVNPGHGDVQKFGEYGEVSDPYIAYGRLFKWAGIQNVLNASVTGYTDRTARQSKDAAETDIDHTFLYGIGKTGLEIGVDFGWTHDLYSTNLHDHTNIVDEVAAYPFAEYAINSFLSLRTVYRGFTYYTTQTSGTWTFKRDEPTQSAGIGIAVTRDIYLYPNVQWVWADVDSRKTNIALSTNINLF